MHTDDLSIIHRGFDNLDFAVKANVSQALAERLASLKERAIDQQEPQPLEIGGAVFHVEMSGMNCYHYRLTNGPLGYQLAIKRPNGRDPWGLYVSYNALPLAIDGWGACVERALRDLRALGVIVRDTDISLGRIDYAVDILFLEAFTFDPHDIVRHSRMKAHVREEMNYTEDASGSPSVRVGSRRGMQLAIYDKRSDVLTKKKPAWWTIWNGNLERLGLPPITADGTKGRIWRFEFRAGKDYLTQKEGVKTFERLRERGGDVIQKIAAVVRLTQPTEDQTRSRWPDHPAYARVKEALRDGLIEMTSGVAADAVREVIRSELAVQLIAQAAGTGLAYAEAADLGTDNWEVLPDTIGRCIARHVEGYGEALPDRIEKIRNRYRFLDKPLRNAPQVRS